MINLLILFASHCFGDFAFQGDFITKWKGRSLLILLAHCAIYTVTVGFGMVLVGINDGILARMDWEWILGILFYTHFIIDLIKCKFRTKLYNGNETEIDVDFNCTDDLLRKRDCLLFVVDQFIHCLIILALYMSI